MSECEYRCMNGRTFQLDIELQSHQRNTAYIRRRLTTANSTSRQPRFQVVDTSGIKHGCSMLVLHWKHSSTTAPSIWTAPSSTRELVLHTHAHIVLQTSTMQLSNVFKTLLVASACLIPSIAAVPTPLEALVKKEDCCDPDFFFPCLLLENLNCSPDSLQRRLSNTVTTALASMKNVIKMCICVAPVEDEGCSNNKCNSRFQGGMKGPPVVRGGTAESTGWHHWQLLQALPVFRIPIPVSTSHSESSTSPARSSDNEQAPTQPDSSLSDFSSSLSADSATPIPTTSETSEFIDSFASPVLETKAQSSPATTTAVSSTLGSGHKNNIGVIVGSALGALGVVILIVAFLLMRWQRKRQGKAPKQVARGDRTGEIIPFNLDSQSLANQNSGNAANGDVPYNQEKLSRRNGRRIGILGQRPRALSESSLSPNQPRMMDQREGRDRHEEMDSDQNVAAARTTRSQSIGSSHLTSRQARIRHEAEDSRVEMRRLQEAVMSSNDGVQDLRIAMAAIMEHIQRLDRQFDSDWARGLSDEPPPEYHEIVSEVLPATPSAS
ncbi:hypothetical protein K435DRAFT_849630 [Dendrothele bispora CBS 962.96]|uniref:Uncharacterized protein n=1 Tax=Dendrothele bispora (strain CBS 962.96) TaxID=1314807 RepID=A0A4S8MRZ4_DENBC|nr:hypothetical protein K435DRAFT_849630 [Dendrothele bispora CBS 962.96]